MPDALREELADYAHRAWAKWMRYLFSRGDRHFNGSVTLPVTQVSRWQRQMNTSYGYLPEDEKASDRKEADEMLEIFNKYRKAKG